MNLFWRAVAPFMVLIVATHGAYSASMEQVAKQVVEKNRGECEDYRAGGEQFYKFAQKMEGNQETSKFLLIELPCSLAAYNSAQRWFLVDQYEEVTPLAFAQPELDIIYTDGSESAELQSITISGYSATVQISNSDFDPKTLTLSAGHKWRGIGDAYDFAQWTFLEGQFILTRYEVDPTFDGEDSPLILIGKKN